MPRFEGMFKKRIGELLIDLDMISEEDLRNALRQQRADRLGLCPVFESLNRTELIGIGNHFSEVSLSSDQTIYLRG